MPDVHAFSNRGQMTSLVQRSSISEYVFNHVYAINDEMDVALITYSKLYPDATLSLVSSRKKPVAEKVKLYSPQFRLGQCQVSFSRMRTCRMTDVTGEITRINLP